MASLPEEERDLPNGCFGYAELRAFALGALSSGELEAIGVHLADCQDCQEALDRLNTDDDPFVRRLRRAARRPNIDPGLKELLARARRMPLAADGSLPPDSSPPEWDALPVPKRLGQYRLSGRIGQGSMGTVYRAWHVRLKREVVIKLLSPQRIDDPEAVARFAREIEAIGKLDDHPNIVRARDADEIDGHHFLVMDYVPGLDVARLLARVGPLTVSDACDIVRQASLGLDYAHGHGIVHRDVKPGNLLLTTAGVVKVLDLGLATFRRQRDLADERLVVGTADYMAPEQWTGSDPIDTRADIYGLGCTLFKLLAGRPPYVCADGDTGAKRRAHLHGPIPSLSALVPPAPPELQRIVARMLAKAPADRYARPADVADALAPFASSSDLPGLGAKSCPADAETDSAFADLTYAQRLSAPLRKMLRRPFPRLAVAAAVTVAAVLATALASRYWMGRDARFRVLISGDAESVLHRYVARHDALFVQSADTTLFESGSTDEESFSMRTQLGQKNWQAGAGIFFGYQADVQTSRTVHWFQTIGLRATGRGDAGASFELAWCQFRVFAQPGSSMTWERRDIASVPVPLELRSLQHTLQVNCDGPARRELLWDGEVVAVLVAGGAASGWPTLDGSGAYGLVNTRGATVFGKTAFRGRHDSIPHSAQRE